MDEIFKIRNSHIAVLHLLMLNLASQRALNDEIINVLSKVSNEDANKIKNRINALQDRKEVEIRNSLYKVYGIVDLDNLLSEPL
jgi:hypothetical protein